VAEWMTARLADRSHAIAAGSSCSGSSPDRVMDSLGHAMRWPIRRSKRPTKKLKPLLREVATALPQATVELRESGGGRRTPHRLETAAPPRVGARTGRSAPPRAGAAPLRLVMARRLRASRLYLPGPHRLPPGLGGQHRALRSRVGGLCPPGGTGPRKQIVLVLDQAGGIPARRCASQSTSTSSSCRPYTVKCRLAFQDVREWEVDEHRGAGERLCRPCGATASE
jgi:hypothetical protein